MEFYRDTLRTFKIISIRSLARRGRRAGAFADQIPARGWRGVEKGCSVSLRSSRRTCWGSGEGEGMAAGGVPTAAEAAAEGCSSARRFRRGSRAMLRSRSCDRRRGSYLFG
jgi:hypothetical protein